MFWGISCDSGKRYSQNVNASYHVSMASLETRDSSYAKKAVSLMVEHKNNEFLLCTLQYEHCMQVNLDLLFKKGEDVTFFLNGQGTVHLTGYLIEDDDDSIAPPPSDDGVQIMDDFEDSSMSLGEDNRKSRQHLKRSSRPTGNNEILEGDDSDDDDSDYVPTKDNSKKKNDRDKPDVNGRKADVDESDDEEEEEDDDDDDDDDEEDDDEKDNDEEEDDDEEENEEQQQEKVLQTNQKRKVQTTGGNDPKRIKKAYSADPQASKDVPKKPKGQKPNVKESIPTISVEDEEDEEEEESDEDSDEEDSNEVEEEDMESSIGRTPMPPKRQESVKKPSQVQMKLDFVPSPSATKNLTEKAKDPSVNKNKKKKKDNSINALEKSYSKKLKDGVEVEDMRIGNGPVATKTRMAHIYYVGRLINNTIFDSTKTGGKAFAFRMGRGEVIKGLDIGMEGMKVGGKRKIKIPPNMGYGKKPTGSIPANSTLYFTVELKAIT